MGFYQLARSSRLRWRHQQERFSRQTLVLQWHHRQAQADRHQKINKATDMVAMTMRSNNSLNAHVTKLVAHLGTRGANVNHEALSSRYVRIAIRKNASNHKKSDLVWTTRKRFDRKHNSSLAVTCFKVAVVAVAVGAVGASRRATAP